MASEEIGIINPQMLTLAVSTHESARIIGMPECELVLAHCAISLAKSPKNWDVVKAVKRVKLLLEGQGENGEPNILGNAPIPSHLQNRNSNPGSHFSKSYIYPPDDPIGAKNQTYLPEALIGTKFLK